MAKYVKKPFPVEAVRFDGDIVGEFDHEAKFVKPGTCPPWITTPIREVNTFVETQRLPNSQMCMFGRSIFINSFGSIVEAHAGDWLLRARNGQILVCPHDIFECEYEAA